MWPNLLVAGVSAVAAVIAAIIAARSAAAARRLEASAQQVRDLENRIAEHKFSIYEPMLELLRGLLDGAAGHGLPTDLTALRSEISKFSAWIAIYGSDEAVTYFQRFMQCTYKAAPSKVIIRMYAEFVLAARRDMGYPETRVTGEHVMGIRLKDIYEPEWLDVFAVPIEDLCAKESWTPPWSTRLTSELRS